MLAFVFPGQGSQRKGMGRDLFDSHARECALASEILGYSISGLCLADEGNRLRDTRFAQPALFVVSALESMARIEAGRQPAFYAGHSLGEYSALFAAGCFDFETGLRLVQKRGELMGRANGGGMLAVMGQGAERASALIAAAGIDGVDVANYNSAQQVVLSGAPDDLQAAARRLQAELSIRCVPLNVSAAFHSRHMQGAAREFAAFLRGFAFSAPHTPVISNVTAQPFDSDATADLLTQQICSPVRWFDCMQYLSRQGVDEIEELGPGDTLTRLWETVSKGRVGRRQAMPMKAHEPPASSLVVARKRMWPPEMLGCRGFRSDYRIRYAYLAGSMFRGIASAEMVIRLGQAGLMGFLGTGGIDLADIEQSIRKIKASLPATVPWGANLLHAVDDVEREQSTVEAYLRHDVHYVEASAFVRVTAPVVHYRFKDAHRNAAGRPVAVRNVLAKVSRPEIAKAFMQPAPQEIVDALVNAGKLTRQEGEIARLLPVARDICVEADSGGHTDGGVATALMPAILRLRDEIVARYSAPEQIRIGAAGGIGSPEAAASAFMLGADFIVTGSINQCSPQAATSDTVKDMLSVLDAHDTDYAPAGDMLQLGARVQVVRKGTLFPARANKLLQLLHQCNSLDELDEEMRARIEKFYFKRSLDEVWSNICSRLAASGSGDELQRAERSPKEKMLRVFQWYFDHSIRLALEGNANERVNYQIHCGPAMGAFNAAVKGTDLEDWRNRHVDHIAERLMQDTAALLEERFNRWATEANQIETIHPTSANH